MKKAAFFILLVVLIAIAFWRFDDIRAYIEYPPSDTNTSQNTEHTVPAVKVIVQPVEMTANNRVFEAVGTGRARLSVGLYPSVSEEVREVLFEAQQKVHKGDVLVQLDDREEQLAVQLAEVRMEDLQSLLSRYEQSGMQGAVPHSQVDTARANFKAAQVELEQAQLALEERKIIAPFDGVVGIPNVDPGDRVNTDTLITGLDARDVLHIDFEVPEALVGKLQQAQAEHQKITATTPAYPGRIFSGYITAQESRIDPQRRMLLARATIQNEDDLLRPGMSFETYWEIPGNSYPTVPEIAVQWGREGSFIWVVRTDKAAKIPARVIARKAGRVLLEAEVKDGEPIVVEGVQRLRPELPVEILGETKNLHENGL